jgi:hypothetical protein
MLGMVSYSRRLKSGQIMCYLNRTYHVLLTPLFTTLAVFAALYERAFDLDLGSQQMLPLVPTTGAAILSPDAEIAAGLPGATRLHISFPPALKAATPPT